jgi:hypoxanthine phosphoribosyltransferase
MENIDILIDRETIAARVKELAAEISRDYAGKTVTLLCMLKGSIIFFADLAREIDLDVEMEFMKVSSYGGNKESAGKVKLDYPPDGDLSGKHVILVEDIIDMGYTAKWLINHLQSLKPASFALCVLLDKPERRKVHVETEYLGFIIPDEFIVGYGLDFSQKYRNLPFVGILKNEVNS